MYVQRGKKKSVCMPGLGSVLVVVHIYVQRYINKKERVDVRLGGI